MVRQGDGEPSSQAPEPGAPSRLILP
jgi:hypothetical protein